MSDYFNLDRQNLKNWADMQSYTPFQKMILMEYFDYYRYTIMRNKHDKSIFDPVRLWGEDNVKLWSSVLDESNYKGVLKDYNFNYEQYDKKNPGDKPDPKEPEKKKNKYLNELYQHYKLFYTIDELNKELNGMEGGSLEDIKRELNRRIAHRYNLGTNQVPDLAWLMNMEKEKYGEDFDLDKFITWMKEYAEKTTGWDFSTTDLEAYYSKKLYSTDIKTQIRIDRIYRSLNSLGVKYSYSIVHDYVLIHLKDTDRNILNSLINRWDKEHPDKPADRRDFNLLNKIKSGDLVNYIILFTGGYILYKKVFQYSINSFNTYLASKVMENTKIDPLKAGFVEGIMTNYKRPVRYPSDLKADYTGINSSKSDYERLERRLDNLVNEYKKVNKDYKEPVFISRKPQIKKDMRKPEEETPEKKPEEETPEKKPEEETPEKKPEEEETPEKKPEEETPEKKPEEEEIPEEEEEEIPEEEEEEIPEEEIMQKILNPAKDKVEENIPEKVRIYISRGEMRQMNPDEIKPEHYRNAPDLSNEQIASMEVFLKSLEEEYDESDISNISDEELTPIKGAIKKSYLESIEMIKYILKLYEKKNSESLEDLIKEEEEKEEEEKEEEEDERIIIPPKTTSSSVLKDELKEEEKLKEKVKLSQKELIEPEYKKFSSDDPEGFKKEIETIDKGKNIEKIAEKKNMEIKTEKNKLDDYIKMLDEKYHLFIPSYKKSIRGDKIISKVTFEKIFENMSEKNIKVNFQDINTKEKLKKIIFNYLTNFELWQYEIIHNTLTNYNIFIRYMNPSGISGDKSMKELIKELKDDNNGKIPYTKETEESITAEYGKDNAKNYMEKSLDAHMDWAITLLNVENLPPYEYIIILNKEVGDKSIENDIFKKHAGKKTKNISMIRKYLRVLKDKKYTYDISDVANEVLKGLD